MLEKKRILCGGMGAAISGDLRCEPCYCRARIGRLCDYHWCMPQKPLPGRIRLFPLTLLGMAACSMAVAPKHSVASPARPLESSARPAADQGRKLPVVAVLDFQGSGIGALPDSVADRISHHLKESGRFQVKDRDSVSKWKSPSTGRILARCNEWECAFRAGRIMGVDRVVIGSMEFEASKSKGWGSNILRNIVGERFFEADSGSLESGRFALSARMLDVSGEAFGNVGFRTEKGRRDLLDVGCPAVVAEFAEQERKVDSVRASRAGGASDAGRVVRLESELRSWRLATGTSAILGAGALGVGMSLFVLNSVGCAFHGEGVCQEPDRTPEQLWIASGVALEVFAIVSAVAAVQRSRELNRLEKARAVNVSLAPIVDPYSRAVGLATRLAF